MRPRPLSTPTVLVPIFPTIARIAGPCRPARRISALIALLAFTLGWNAVRMHACPHHSLVVLAMHQGATQHGVLVGQPR